MIGARQEVEKIFLHELSKFLIIRPSPPTLLGPYFLRLGFFFQVLAFIYLQPAFKLTTDPSERFSSSSSMHFAQSFIARAERRVVRKGPNIAANHLLHLPCAEFKMSPAITEWRAQLRLQQHLMASSPLLPSHSSLPLPWLFLIAFVSFALYHMFCSVSF